MNDNAVSDRNVVKTGQRVSLRLEIDGQERIYSSRIEELLADAIAISWPSERLAQIPVAIGDRARLEVRNDQGVFRLASVICGKNMSAPPTLLINRLGEWSREQSRWDIRLEITLLPSETVLLPSDEVVNLCGIPAGDSHQDMPTNGGRVNLAIAPVETRILPGNWKGDGDGNPTHLDSLQENSSKTCIAMEMPIASTIRNVSAGGLLLTTGTRLGNGDRIRIRFALEKGLPEIVAIAEVKWAEWEVLPGTQVNRIGCQFLGMHSKERDEIRKFIFARQIKLRRSGLL